MKKLLLFAILCVSISDLNAQNLASTVQKIKSLHNVSYTDVLKFKFFFQDQPSIDTLKVLAVNSINEPQFGGYYSITGKTNSFLFDGDKAINLDLQYATYKISSEANQNQWTRNLLYWGKQMEKYLNTTSKIKLLKDTLVNKIAHRHFLIKKADTIIKGKHVYDLVNIIINKTTNLPYSIRSDVNGFSDDGAFGGFIEEHTFKKYQINKQNFPDLSNAIVPANFKSPVDKKRLPMFAKGTLPPKINLYDAAGAKFDLEKLKGKLVLLSFTTLGCPHAINSVQMLTKLKKQYKNSELAIISIYQLGSNDKKAIAKFNRKMDIKYPSYTTESTAEDMYHLQGYPDFYLLDKEGIIVQGYDGFYAGLEKELTNKIDSIK